jgi:Flp pilus assembly protein TadG
MKMILKSQKGSITILFVLSLPVFLCALVMSWDIGKMYTAKITARNGVTIAARAAASELDLNMDDLYEFEEPVLLINEDKASVTFQSVLQENLNKHKGSLFAIDDNTEQFVNAFVVANSPGEYQVGGRRVQITQPAVAAEIEVPVELSVFGKLVLDKDDNKVTVKAFTVVAPEIREEIED